MLWLMKASYICISTLFEGSLRSLSGPLPSQGSSNDHRHRALWLWTGENGSWHFITVPEEQSDEIRAHCLAFRRGFRSARVEARRSTTSLGARRCFR